MKIFVCAKQVPDTTGKVAVNPNGTLNRASMPTITNPDDLNAMEVALQIKDQTACEIIVITMGPPKSEEMLREFLAMGADRAVLVTSREFGGSDTFATSQILAASIQQLGFADTDLILCGQQAIDGDTAQVGPQIAEKLHIPQITFATAVAYGNKTLQVKRSMGDGSLSLSVSLPCLIACEKQPTPPRYMSVQGIFHCYEKPITRLDYQQLAENPLIDRESIGLQGSPTNVFLSFTKLQRSACQTYCFSQENCALVADAIQGR